MRIQKADRLGLVYVGVRDSTHTRTRLTALCPGLPR